MKDDIVGTLVEVNGHKMNVFQTGEGKDTLVFLSGFGTSCPVLDFKPLWSLLTSEYKTVVVERAGYGWSETTSNPRDLDTVLEEDRAALSLLNIEAPYIIVPHSVSGLEAIYWAQKYPSEVKAIIGLDAAIPEVYDILKLPSQKIVNVIGYLAKVGVHKPFAKAICKKDPAVLSGYLTETDKETYIEIFKKSTFTSAMVNEVKYIEQNRDKVKSGAIPCNTPMYAFISSANEKIVANWSKLLSEYATNTKNGKYMVLDCGHYVHACQPEIIAKEIKDFIFSIGME